MCGITGQFNLTKQHKIDANLIKRMTMALLHRGPDEMGIYKDNHIGMGHARLSIIDLAGGRQPIHNEDHSIWIVYNGEVFNYVELKETLVSKGHKFATNTDTEVLIHLYEEKGVDMLNDLNGQFAFAIWDTKRRQLMIARDRVGIRPLFYTVVDGSLIFGSEIKAMLQDPRLQAEIDPIGLDQFFTFWSTLSPRTNFKNISELPPAHYLIAKDGNITIKRYWDLNFPAQNEPNGSHSEEYYAEELLSLLMDSIKIRLRADVPVAAYLSGGLDSSFISALVKKFFNDKLQTFSVSFTDKHYDESKFQKQTAKFIGTRHREISCSYEDIGRIMPEVIWHAEKPLIRTAPAPLFLLSKLVRDSNIKVVLTGEGADEILAGYDLFREMKIRRFWAKNPDSKFRPALFSRLYQYIPNWPKMSPAYLTSFYKAGLTETDKTYYSHIPRWNTTSQVKQFFSEALKNELKDYNCIGEMESSLSAGFSGWDSLSQAQYLEITTLLSGNLLSSQGDRMMMAHSVEGRLPFLDYRVIEFCANLPSNIKLKGLTEKYILKKIAKPFLPEAIPQRQKQAYRSPDSASFFQPKADPPAADNGTKLNYVDELLSEQNLVKTGYFNPVTVSNLVKKCKTTDPSLLGTRYNMSIVGIITTLLLDKLFIQN
jgi:asparagine synthase (glutamine-hydrolysing)